MSDAHIPIDIHASKLLEWLVSRRHCNKDWMKGLTSVREKIRSAMQDMPEHEEIGRLLGGQQMNYYLCKRVIEILKETERGSKNVFGYYSSQRMIDWQDIVAAYEKDNLFMAEVAQIITRNVSIEVPNMRKQISRLENQVEENRKKSLDCIKRGNQLRLEYVAAAERLGITGDNPKEELTQKLQILPSLVESIESKVADLGDSLKFYKDFTCVVSSVDNIRNKLVPALTYVVTHGNTTLFEHRYGYKPEVVEHYNCSLENEDNMTVGDDGGIDFGDDGGIDFGAEDDGGIDFGVEELNSNPSTTNSGSDNGFVHLEDVDPLMNSVSVIEPGNKVARGLEALTVIEYQGTRDQILNDLVEVISFLDQRRFELEMADLQTTMMLMMESTLGPVSADMGKIVSMTMRVQEVMDLMTTEQIKVLYSIRDNPQYIEIAVTKLQQKADLSTRTIRKGKELQDKEPELIQENKILFDQIPGIISFTKSLQLDIAKDISKKYKGRPVNIMAGAQVL